MKFETPIKSYPSALDGSDIAERLTQETVELLDDTGGDGIYQRMRIRIDGEERWISKSRLFDRKASEYSDSFVLGLRESVRAYGRALAIQAGDLDPDDPIEDADESLIDVDFEILETVVETITDNADAVRSLPKYRKRMSMREKGRV